MRVLQNNIPYFQINKLLGLFFYKNLYFFGHKVSFIGILRLEIPF